MDVGPQFEFHHVGISVPDLEVAARWWEHMFGFKIAKRFRIEPANADVILLSKGNLNVELFQASGAAPLPHDRRIPIKDIGTHGTKHAAFRINNLDEFLVAVRAKGATLKATEQPIDTSTSAGKAFLDMLGVFAEFETNLRRERQLEGIAVAKAKGVYKGRPASIEAARVKALKAEGLGASEIAKRLGVARASIYRILGSER